MKKRFAQLLALVLATSMCLTACGGGGGSSSQSGGGSQSSDGERTPKDTIVVLTNSEPATLDPARANNENIGVVNRFVTNAVFDLNADGTYSNCLAEDWEMVDDTTLRIKLKEGILFSTGTPLTAEDVLWHYVRTSQQSVSASQFVFVDAENSYVEDELTVVIKFTQPWAPFLNTLATARGQIVSKQAYEEMGEEAFARAPVGTGPYKIVEWVSGSHISLTANEYYWGGEVKTPNILIRFVEESSGRVIELETGAADIAYYIEGSDIQRVEEIPGYHIESGDSYRYYVIMLSMQEPLFQDQRVRYAMSYAIDKEALVNVCTNGVGIPINTMGPPLVIEGMKEQPEIPYDVEEAKRLMAEAGYADGFSIELHVEPGTLFERLAQAVQSMWGEIGIDVQIVTSALATYEAQNGGKFQASIRDGTAQEISNVWTVYESSFGSRMQGNDDWLDEKLLELRTYYQGDPQRDALLDEISDYLYEIRFSYPFMTMPTIYAVSDNLEGFEFHPGPNYLHVENWVVYE